jgi:hypothetical protein
MNRPDLAEEADTKADTAYGRAIEVDPLGRTVYEAQRQVMRRQKEQVL